MTVTAEPTLSLLTRRSHLEELARRASRNPEDVKLLVVSKNQPPEKLLPLIQAGQRDFGESYLQEALPKIQALQEFECIWHFIGPIQSNKTQDIARYFDVVHSISRLKIIEKLARERSATQKPLQVFIQVNIDNDPAKSGCAPTEALLLAREILTYPTLEFVGLMTILKDKTDLETQRQSFQKLASLRDQISQAFGRTLQLSMGMSQDYPQAIHAGANWVRIGTKIFEP